jgi:hypothetical protein
VCRLQAFVSEPQRDRRQVDAGLEEMHGRRVSPMSLGT